MVPRLARALIVNQGRYLLLRKPWQGKELWETPGGKLKEGEDPCKGILREVFEETALRPAILRKEKSFTVDGQTEVFVFLLQSVGDHVTISPEHTGYRWFTAQEIMELSDTFYPELLQKFVGDCERFLSGHKAS